MNQYKRLLVGLDFSELDKKVIQYTENLAKKIQTKKIYFLHVAKDLNALKEQQLTSALPIDETLLRKVQNQVRKYFINYEQFDIDYQIKEGSPSKQLIHWAELKQVDLVIVGKKPYHRGRGIIPQQIVRNSPSSVLMVPEKSSFKCETIVVPIDFSQYSKSAFQMALQLAQSEHQSTLFPYHLYSLPLHLTGEPVGFDAPEPLIKSAAIKSYNNFITDLDFKGVDVNPKFHVNYESVGGIHVVEFAEQNNADLIVLGSQGKTGLKRLFLGSFAENIVQENENIPILIWKQTANYRSSINTSAKEFNQYMSNGRKEATVREA